MTRHPIIESVMADIEGLDFADDDKRQDAEDSIICTVQTLIDRLATSDVALAAKGTALERRKEWQDAIIGLCKALGSDDMPWGGDKTGWGFIFYFVKHLHTRATAAEAELERVKALGELRQRMLDEALFELEAYRARALAIQDEPDTDLGARG